jgi:2-iminobutanoate/2-iminopropanoate deaminase
MAAPVVGPYTPVVRAGDFLYVSGQIGLDESGHLVEGLVEQARLAISNLEQLLREHGAGLDKVVKTTVFLSDMAEYALMNDIYGEMFGDHKPARAAMAVKGLPKAAQFEIEAIAYVG